MRTLGRISVVLLGLAGCGGKSDTGTGSTSVTDTSDNPDAGCTTAPADAPAADAITAGGSSVVCYYGPEVGGYCRDLQDPASAAMVEGGDKASIGCADAIIVTNGTCPTDELVGRCLNWTATETRSYYTCNQYDALFPGGPQEACESGGGTWEPA